MYTQKQNELYNKARMTLDLKYRAKSGGLVQIFKPTCPKPQKRVK